MSIFVISGFLLFFGVVAVGGVGYFIYARSHKNKILNESEPVVSKPIPAVDFASLGIEKLLLQINEKVLDSVGEIQKGAGEFALVWKDARNQEKKLIDVKGLAGNQISINDKVYAATKEDAKSGIIEALRNQVKK